MQENIRVENRVWVSLWMDGFGYSAVISACVKNVWALRLKMDGVKLFESLEQMTERHAAFDLLSSMRSAYGMNGTIT